jgi:hypothetical protein
VAGFLGGVVLFVFVLFVGMPSLIVRGCVGFFVACHVLCAPPVCSAPVVLGWFGLVVCVTSCEGHVVDALASRADEGRRSLR